jgi:AcrR family transcriptional regulator
MPENKKVVMLTRKAAQAERTAFTEKCILDAAEITFGRRGLTGTRVREIAEAAGVNAATLYNYYPSKEALYEAVLERGVRPLITYLAEFAASAQESGSPQRVVRAVMTHLAERPHLSKLIYSEVISEGDFLPTLARKWFSPIIDQIVAELKVRPAPKHIDEGIFHLVATLFIHLSFGHFALAPLLQEATGKNPINTDGIEGQTRLIEALLHHLFPRLEDGAGENKSKR